MAKKSKEIELGGYRIQVDPLILVRRVLTRQKRLLVILCIVGAIATAAFYKITAKEYTSNAEILIRAETVNDEYLRKFLNVVARYVSSDTEMMIIINELDLYAQARATLPYDLALRRMRKELKIDRPGGAITIGYRSKSPQEAQRVVAFVTERILTKLADLKDSPYRQQLDAIDQGIADVEPRFKAASLEMFEFRGEHPDIAIRSPEVFQQGSPIASLTEEIDRANKDLTRCYAPAGPVEPRPKRKMGPACQAVQDREKEFNLVKERVTPSHPDHIASEGALKKQRQLCEQEQGGQEEGGSAPRAAANPTDCAASVTEKIRRLGERKMELERGASRKPALQRRWTELTIAASTLEMQSTALREARAKTLKDRLLAANEFRDSFVLVDAPRLPEIPSFPDRNQFLGFGLAVTAILAMFIATLREAFRQTFADPRELEEQTGIPVLAALPNFGGES